MLTLITAAGLILAVIVFLNLISAGKVQKLESDDLAERPRANVRKIMAAQAESPQQPRLRLCPLCGTVLNQDEYLFASFLDEPPGGGKRQAHIYGCRHCFTTDGVNVGRSGRELSRIEP